LCPGFFRDDLPHEKGISGNDGAMSWLQLDPESIAGRARTGGTQTGIPSLAASLLRGIIGFTLVSVAGFAPWAIGGRWFHRTIGEAGLYATCALVFIGLSGPLLHRLIIGPGSLARFYKLFAIVFAVYSVAWIVGWMSLRGHVGSVTGLLAGTAVMGWMLTRAFDANGASVMMKVIAALFVLNSLGYFIGGWVEGNVAAWKEFSLFGVVLGKPARMTLAMLLWGVCYGAGFGAGLGLAFHLCQTGARALLLERKA
jgi:hypothetical protein